MSERPSGEFTSLSSIHVAGKEDWEHEFDIGRWDNTPEPEEGIWRYKDFEKYISILSNESIWFSRPDQFSDPFEGSLPEKNISERLEKYKSETHKTRVLVRKSYRYTTYLNCWYNDSHESDAMWRLYSNSGKGLAIKSTPSKLKESMEHSDDAIFGNVKYIDYSSEEISLNNTLAPLFHKRKAFEHENEFRVLLHFMSTDVSGIGADKFDEIQPNGVPVSVDLDKLVDKIVISPNATSEFEDLIYSVTEEFGYDFEIVTSDLNRDPLF